jgi:hypothetical protein
VLDNLELFRTVPSPLVEVFRGQQTKMLATGPKIIRREPHRAASEMALGAANPNVRSPIANIALVASAIGASTVEAGQVHIVWPWHRARFIREGKRGSRGTHVRFIWSGLAARSTQYIVKRYDF